MSSEPTSEFDDGQVVILNPTSGSGDHVEAVKALSDARRFSVRETEEAGDAIEFTEEAVERGASLVVAAGGDGTVNEVIRGIDATGAFDDVRFGVVPCGTGNDFAGNIGVHGIEQAFDVLEDGEYRNVDLGTADDRPFVNSCVSGLTADASAETGTDLKQRLGTVAYVLNTLRTLKEFDGIRVTVDAFDVEGETPTWSGSAIAVLVGNGRRFPPGGSTQADMEDGHLDVTLVQDTGAVDLMGKAAVEGLLGRDTPGTTRFRTPSLTIDVEEGETTAFSLDGEIIRRRQLSLHTRPGVLRLAVGDEYEPDPE